jgi:hypothetical protein
MFVASIDLLGEDVVQRSDHGVASTCGGGALGAWRVISFKGYGVAEVDQGDA